MSKIVWMFAVFCGVVFAWDRAQCTEVMITPPNSLTVETNQRVYQRGQRVQISIVNNTTNDIPTSIGYSVTTPAGRVVYSAIWPMYMIVVPPGGSLDYVWDQTYSMSHLGADGRKVDPGPYVIHWGASSRMIEIR